MDIHDKQQSLKKQLEILTKQLEVQGHHELIKDLYSPYHSYLGRKGQQSQRARLGDKKYREIKAKAGRKLSTA